MSFIHSIKFRFTVWYLLVLAVLLVALSAGCISTSREASIEAWMIHWNYVQGDM